MRRECAIDESMYTKSTVVNCKSSVIMEKYVMFHTFL